MRHALQKLRGLALDPHAGRVAAPLLASVVAPIALVMIAPALAKRVLQMASLAFLLVAPLVALHGLIVPWVQGERGLLEGAVRSFSALLPGSERHARGRYLPLLTPVLIVINVSIYLGAPDGPRVLDLHAPTLQTLVGSMFSHASVEHLTGNMAFLWILGVLLERRIGPLRLGGLYLLSGAVGTAVELLAHVASCPGPGAPGVYHQLLGASGAVSGLMGLSMVRLFWTQIPVLGSMAGLGGLIGLRMQLPAPLVLSLFCLWDLSALAEGARDGVAHLAHVGGYYSGLLLAYGLGLAGAALHERFVEEGTRLRSGAASGARRDALDQALEMRPDDVDVLIAKAQHQRVYSPTEAVGSYRRAASLLLSKGQPRRAAEVFAEAHALEWQPLSTPEQLAITPHLVALGQRHLAAQALEELLASDAELTPETRGTALGYYAKLLVELGCAEAARDAYARLVRDHPEHRAADAARAYLEKTRDG